MEGVKIFYYIVLKKTPQGPNKIIDGVIDDIVIHTPPFSRFVRSGSKNDE